MTFTTVAVLQQMRWPSGNTVQPRQGRVKIARQELPGKPKDEGQSRQPGLFTIFLEKRERML
jgi:hypothetical protein